MCAIVERMRRLGARSGFVVAAYALFTTMLGTTLPTPLYPLFQERYSFGELLVTVIYGVYALGVIAALILFGNLSDTLGRKPLLLAGLALSVLSAVLFLDAGSLVPVFAARIVSGLSAGIYTGTATAYLVDLAPDGRRRFASVIAVVVNLSGLGVGALLSGILAQYGSDPLRLPFAVDLVLLAPAVVGMLLAPETVGRSGFRLRLQRLSVPPEVRGVLIRGTTAGFAASAVAGVFAAVVPAFLRQTLDLHSPVLAGVLVFFFFDTALVGQLVMRRVGDDTALAAGCVLLLTGAVVLAVGVAAESLAATVASSIVGGLGQGLVFAAALAAINQRAPLERRGEAASVFFVGTYVGLSLPVIAGGLAIQETSLRPAAIAFCVCVAGVALAVLASQLRAARVTSSF